MLRRVLRESAYLFAEEEAWMLRIALLPSYDGLSSAVLDFPDAFLDSDRCEAKPVLQDALVLRIAESQELPLREVANGRSRDLVRAFSRFLLPHLPT